MSASRWSPGPDTADSAIAALAHALRMHGVAFTRAHLRETVRSYPGPLTPLALVDMLQLWGVDTVPMGGTVDELTADARGSLVPMADGRYGVLAGVDGAGVTLMPADGIARHIARTEFDAQWNGMLLALKPREGAGEPFMDERGTAWRQRWGAVLWLAGTVAVLAALAGSPATGLTVPLGALALIKLLGLAASTVLAFEQAGMGRPLQRLCPAGPVANCGQVLRSPASRLGPVPLADLGLVYFGGGLACVIVGPQWGDPAALTAQLSLVSLALLPLTGLSVYYQGMRLRAYCWLCLLVATLLWLEAAVGLASAGWPWRAGAWDAVLWSMSGVGYAAVALVWLGLRALLVQAWQGRALAVDFARWRSQPLVVQALWDVPVQPVPPVNTEIRLGRADAPVQMLLAVLPGCPACGRQVRAAWALHAALGDRMAVSLRFLRGGEPGAAATPALRDQYRVADGVVALLLHAAASGDEAWLRQLCGEWFFNAKERVRTPRAFAAWQSRMLQGRPAPGEDLLKSQVLAQHASLQPLGIDAAPVVFANGRRLPPEWDCLDLRYFLLRQLRRTA